MKALQYILNLFFILSLTVGSDAFAVIKKTGPNGPQSFGVAASWVEIFDAKLRSAGQDEVQISRVFNQCQGKVLRQYAEVHGDLGTLVKRDIKDIPLNSGIKERLKKMLSHSEFDRTVELLGRDGVDTTDIENNFVNFMFVLTSPTVSAALYTDYQNFHINYVSNTAGNLDQTINTYDDVIQYEMNSVFDYVPVWLFVIMLPIVILSFLWSN